MSSFTAFTPALKSDLERKYSVPGSVSTLNLEEWNPVELIQTHFVLNERVDFDLNTMQPAWVGRKAALRVAGEAEACNGRALGISLVVSLSNAHSVEMVTELVEGFVLISGPVHSVSLRPAFGALSLAVSATVIPLERTFWGHSPESGDAICVSGDLGAAFTGLKMMQQIVKAGENPAEVTERLTEFQEAIARYAYPEVRNDFAEAMSASGVLPSWCRFVTGGLHATLKEMLEYAPELDVQLEKTAIPVRDFVFRAAKKSGADAFDWAMNGGEDFEFVFALKPDQIELLQEFYPEFRHIGNVSDGSGQLIVLTDNKPEAQLPER